ncbi:hypothetical protein [Hyphomonas sp.]|jgi:hypothetical protein|uniref:hypothetical protein n=1 Tax=Hyphomonas sp. TaxID=87 RepID=UPI0039E57160
MIRRGAITLACAAVLVACTATGKPDVAETPATTAEPATHDKIRFDGKRATPAERKACVAAGGTVRPDGMLGHDQCIRPYPDAGKSCKSKDDCLGRCLLSPDSDDDVDQPTDDGVCQATDSQFGCVTKVDEGTVQWTICID